MADRNRHSVDFKRKAICAAVAACFHATPSSANPTGAQVVVGQAAFNAQGRLLTVTNSPGTVINWQGFSIAAGETTRFVQPSAQSAVLNRVVAPDPSVILGSLVSNGRVFLVNPAGILVGAGARVDVAGFVASTLNLTNEDFAAGRLRFQAVPNAGAVVNEGLVTTPQGGQVYLVAPEVKNAGVIETPRGETLLAAGRQVELVDTATPGVRVQVDVPGGEAQNLGRIVADSGRIGIVGALVRNSGQLNADTVVRDAGGRIFLKASKSVTLEAGSTTSAKGRDGGSVHAEAGVDGDGAATTTVGGTIDVSGDAGRGGSATLLAPHVALLDGAAVQASGTSGGGTVLVGGDYQGRNAEVQNAKTTHLAQKATVHADATVSGDGGKVIAWSDEATAVHGKITARGGEQGGDGGFVEVSSHRHLAFDGVVSTLAPRGAAGMLLLDPDDVEIGGFDTSATKISSETIGKQLALGNVTLTTSEGSNSGNIKVNHTLELNSSNALTMLAQNDLTVTSPISNSGTGKLKLMAGWDGSSTSAPAVRSGTGTLTVNNGGSISLGGGELRLLAGQGMTVSGGTNVLKTSGAEINLQVSGSGGITLTPSSSSSSIDAGSGLISLTAGTGGVKVSTANTTMTLASTNETLGVSADKLDVGAGTASVNGIASVTNLTVRGGTATFNSDATVSSVSLTSGTLHGAGASGVNATSSLTWSGGTVLGKLTLDSGATGSLSGSSKALGSSTVASRFTNRGTITDTSSSEVSSRLTLNSTSGAATVLDNQGSYSAGSAYGYSILDGGQGGSVTNSGTFDVGSAAYGIANGVSMTNSGTVNLSGGSLSTGTYTNSGLLKLSGTAATDALTVNGNLTLASTSTIRSNVAGTSSTAYGHIGVSGTADLQGKVQFVSADYSPQLNDTFRIVSYASRTSNEFSKVEALFGGTFTTAYDATSATVKLTSLSGGVNAWLTAGDGLWTTLGNWSFGHLPTSTEDAEIASAVGTAVLSSGSQAVRSLASEANVTVSGGTLDLASTSKINGTLTVSGGTVQGAGNLTVKNLALSSGSVGGTGTLTVTDSYARTGGTVSSTLAGLTVTQASGNLVPGVLGVNGAVSLTASNGGLSLDSISASTLFGKASGSVTISSGAKLTATGSGNALTLVDGNAFVNNAGASALSASNGRWLVYSQDPSQDTRGALAYAFKHYGQTYDGTAYSGPGSGNGFLYAVTPKVTPTLTGSVAKTYDGTTAATVAASNIATSGLIDGDSASYATSSASYSDKNAGSGKTVSATVALTVSNGGAAVYGYQVSGTTVSGAVGKIDPATLSVTGLSATNKVYDATTAATMKGGTLSGVLGGDSVTLGTGVASFADKKVGTAKPVTVSSLPLAGTDASNYQLTLPTGLAADITPAPLTVSGLAASNKVYDATTAATVKDGVLSGVLSGDSVTLGTAAASFADKKVGTAKPVTVSSLALAGSDAANYQLTLPTGLAADITPAPLTVSGLAASNKVYDATTAAAITGGTLTGVLSGDAVTVSASGTFADANVGTGKAVSLASLALAGADAANYTLATPTAALTADIAARTLATWTGTGSGLWSDSANWDQGIVPVGSNVLAASLPGAAGMKITYDATAGNTTLKSLDSSQPLVLKGGTLTLGTAASDVSTFGSGAALELQAGGALATIGELKTASYAQSGGTLTGTGNLTVNGTFSHSGGTIALSGAGTASITQTAGDLVAGALGAPAVVLKAQSGAISQTGRIIASKLTAEAATGIALKDAGNEISAFAATNSGSGNIALVNAVPLSIAGITNSGGDVTIDNTGAVTTVGAISAPASAVSIVAHSPLAIGSGGVAAGGSITLSAGQSASAGDDLTLSGKIASSGSGGAIKLSAGDNLLQNAPVASNGGNVTALAESGSIAMGLDGSTSTGGGDVAYSAPGGDIVLTRIDAGSGAIDLVAGGSTLSATGYSGANLVAAKATITAGGNALLTTRVQSLQTAVAGTYAVRDVVTGELLSGGAGTSVAEPVKTTEQAVVAALNPTTSDTSRGTASGASAASPTTAGSSTAASASPSSSTSGIPVATASTTAQPTKTDPQGTIGGGTDEFGATADSSGSQDSSKSSDGKQKRSTESSGKQSETKHASKKLPICR